MDGFSKGTLSFIDIETPNRKNDKICSISIIATRNDEIVSEECYFINPECRFDDDHINIHRITPALVQDKPAFPDAWETMNHYFTNGIIVAHNAPFDLSVLCKALSYYNIDIPDFYYICTLDIARKFGHGSNALPDLCKEYGLDLKTHHDSFHDALACRDLFAALKKRFRFDPDDFVKCYKYNLDDQKSASGNLLKRAMNELSGIVHGLVSDRIVTPDEISAFKNWLDSYADCFKQKQYEETMRIIRGFIESQQVLEPDIAKLNSFIRRFQYKRSSYNDVTQAMQVLMGIIRGLLADRELNEEEILSLQKWIARHRFLAGNYPFNKIEEKINSILEDGVITQKEKDGLYKTLDGFLNPDISGGQKGKKIIFSEAVFCLTGSFNNGSKSDIEKMIADRGGVVKPGVTKNTKYLIVGGAGSEDWKFGNYGSKVNKALQMQENGLDIQIIYEDSFFEDICG